MALTTFTDNLAIIAALDDAPNDTGGLTAAQFKAKFDDGAEACQTYINNTHIPELDASHLPYIYGSSPTIKTTMESLTAGVMPDESVTFAKLQSAVSHAIENNTLNILQLKLQQSLAATDIDAWSDLFADTSLLTLASCNNVAAISGSLAIGSGVSCTDTGSSVAFGKVTTYGKAAQSFTTIGPIDLASITVYMRKNGSPTDNVTMKIFATSGGLPTGSALYTSSTTVSGSSLTETLTATTFSFSSATLSANTVYAFTLERSGSLSDSTWYILDSSSSGTYAGGTASYYTSSWNTLTGYDWKFTVTCETTSGTAIWTAVTPTEALTYMAICANETVGTGSITWYLSDDGTNWTTVSALDTLQNVAFDAAHVYLKCVLTGNATVEAVAYGGY